VARILIAYFSLTGYTQKMADYIAEGIRMTGHEATVSKVSDFKKVSDLEGYDGYIFGSPTFHRDMAEPMKTLLFLANQTALDGKMAGAFGSYTHSGDAPGAIFDTMQYTFKMRPFELGSFNLKENLVETNEGIRACQSYGKVFAEKL
jgi:flavodoxin